MILFRKVGFLQAKPAPFRLSSKENIYKKIGRLPWAYWHGKLKGGKMPAKFRIRKLVASCAMTELLLFIGVVGVNRLERQATAAIAATVMDSSGAAIA